MLVPLFTGTGAVAQDACHPVKFAGGTTSGDVVGTAPPEDVVCYTLETGEGQTASVKVLQGNNIIFSILDVIDAQQDYSFTTKNKTYEIVVGQMMRSVTNEPFRIRFTVTGPS